MKKILVLIIIVLASALYFHDELKEIISKREISIHSSGNNKEGGSANRNGGDCPAGTAEDFNSAKCVNHDPSSQITLVALRETYIQIKDNKVGMLVVTKTLYKGQKYNVPKGRSKTLTTDNAGGLIVFVDGLPVPPIGPDGMKLTDFALDSHKLENGIKSKISEEGPEEKSEEQVKEQKEIKELMDRLGGTTLSPPLSAKWTKVSKNWRGDTLYVDFETIEKQSGYVYSWNLHNYPKPNQFGTYSYIIYEKVDCELSRFKLVVGISHTKLMGGGTGKSFTPKNIDWTYPPINSARENILKEVCSAANEL